MNECKCSDECYVTASFKNGFVPIGTFPREWAELIAKQYEEKHRFNPLFEYVSIN